MATLFFCFYIVDMKSPEEDLYGKVTKHSTRLDNDLAGLLSHKMADKYKSFLSPAGL